jgi:NADPH:quinone reductase-like Zn-dependent oxidoreductase
MSPPTQSIPTHITSWDYARTDGGLHTNLRLTTTPFPTALLQRKPTYSLVRVHSAALNPADYGLQELLPTWLLDLITPKPATPGLDYAGEIVGGSRDGARVWGSLGFPLQHGTLGQYVLAPVAGMGELPLGLSFDEGAAMGVGALAAYASIVPYVTRGRGERVFINGGSGGVGTYSIQIAKLMGCYVVVSCSGRNVELCRGLGADEVVDYSGLPGADVGSHLARLVGERKMERFDLVVDNVGHDPLLHSKSQGFVKGGGLFMLLAAMFGNWSGRLSMLDSWLRPSWLGGVPIRWKHIVAQPEEKVVSEIGTWVTEGKLKVVIDRTFAFDVVPKAYEYLKTGRARGRVVVSGIESA